MRNIFIFLCIGSLWGCQTQESAYRMGIKDSLYRDDSLLAINVLQQLNTREKGDSTVSDSSASIVVQGAIKLFTLTKELRYEEEKPVEDSISDSPSDSLVESKEVKTEKTKVEAKPKPKTSSPTISPKASTTTPVAAPAAKTPAAVSPAPAPAKPVEAAKVPSPPPAASPVKQ